MITLMDFYADWCGPCHAMRPIFEEVEKEYSGKVEFKKVDVEVEGELASSYNIFSIPTFVLVREGEEIARKTGAMPKETLKSWIDANL